MDGKDRVHGDYVEGVLENIVFDEEDIEFAAEHDLVHTALWGKAENTLPMIAAKGIPIAFDYADRLDHPLVEETLPYVTYGFYSYHEGRDAKIEEFLKDKVSRGMKIAVVTFGEDEVYNQADAEGFINLFGLPLTIRALMKEKNEK